MAEAGDWANAAETARNTIAIALKYLDIRLTTSRCPDTGKIPVDFPPSIRPSFHAAVSCAYQKGDPGVRGPLGGIRAQPIANESSTHMRRLLLALLLATLPFACNKPEARTRPPSTKAPAATPPAIQSATEPAVSGPSEDSTVNTTQPGQKPRVRAWSPQPVPTGEVNLITMGCWGMENDRQRLTGQHMGNYVTRARTQFNAWLSLGDNMYDKLTGIDDMKWEVVFEDAYDERINMPVYAVLGNHDFENGKEKMEFAYVAKNPTSRFKLPARWYRLEMPEAAPFVTILMLDSDRHKMTQAQWDQENAWLEAELAKPRKTRWLICAAHHPLFSNGQHGDNGLLQRDWGLLFTRYRVDFFVCAHEHNLQHLEVPAWPTSYVVAGGGGRPRTELRRSDRGPFSRSLNGFAHFRLLPDRAVVTMVNGKDGKVVHQFARSTSGLVSVLVNTPSDKGNLKLKPLKPFDEGDKTTPLVPSMSPEPTTQPTTQPAP